MPNRIRLTNCRASVHVIVCLALSAGCASEPPRSEAPAPVEKASAVVQRGEELPPEPNVSTPEPAVPDFLSVDYRAFGNEPFWEVRFTRDGVVYRPLAGPVLEFPFGQMRRRARADAMKSSIDGHSINVTVSHKPCTDDMSGQAYDYSATVEIDGRELNGCAIDLFAPAASTQARPQG